MVYVKPPDRYWPEDGIVEPVTLEAGWWTGDRNIVLSRDLVYAEGGTIKHKCSSAFLYASHLRYAGRL